MDVLPSRKMQLSQVSSCQRNRRSALKVGLRSSLTWAGLERVFLRPSSKNSSTKIVPTPATLLPSMNNVVPFLVFPQARRAVDWSIPFWTGLQSTRWWWTLGAILMHNGVPQGSVIGPLLFLLFVNGLLDVLEALTLLFEDDVKLVSRWTQNMNLHSSLTTALDWSKKWDLPINPAKCNNISQLGEKFRWDCLFFPDGSGTPIPVSKLVKDLGVQTDNVFSLSLLSALKSQIRQEDWSSW